MFTILIFIKLFETELMQKTFSLYGVLENIVNIGISKLVGYPEHTIIVAQLCCHTLVFSSE